MTVDSHLVNIISIIVLAAIAMSLTYVWLAAVRLRRQLGQQDGTKLLNSMSKIIAATVFATVLSLARVILSFLTDDFDVLRSVLAVIGSGVLLLVVYWELIRIGRDYK